MDPFGILLIVGAVAAIAWYFGKRQALTRRLKDAKAWSIGELPEDTLGKIVGVTRPVGETLTARARVVNELPQPAPMVMLDLPVPAGFAPVLEDFALLQETGQIAKFQKDVVLSKQPFVMDPDVTIEQLVANSAKELGSSNLHLAGFVRLALGEGVEKVEGPDFASEVASMMGGN